MSKKPSKVHRQKSLLAVPPDFYEGRAIERSLSLAIISIDSAERELIEVVGHVGFAVLFIEGVPDQLAVKLLRRNLDILQPKVELRHQIAIATDILNQTIEECKPIIDQLIPGKIQWERHDVLRATAKDFADALKAMFPRTDEGESDNGAALRITVAKHGGKKIQEALQAQRNDPIKLKGGREPGATPLNRFILEETKRIKGLHNFSTRGEICEQFIKELKTDPDVQAWINRTRTDLRIEGQKAAVQAYGMFSHLDYQQRAGKLREIENNDSRRQKKGGV